MWTSHVRRADTRSDRKHGQRTERLRSTLAAIGLALAGRAGARLTHVVGVPIGRSTVLRLVDALPEPEVPAPRVVGVDEYATRKGRNYGTVLVDVETRRPVDLLPDRDSSSLAAWLAERPGIEVVCRDRAPFFAEGATAGAAQAVQVADRWHLWHNLSEAAERSIAQHRQCLHVLVPETPETTEAEPDPAEESSGSPWPTGHRFADRTRTVTRTIEYDRQAAADAAAADKAAGNAEGYAKDARDSADAAALDAEAARAAADRAEQDAKDARAAADRADVAATEAEQAAKDADKYAKEARTPLTAPNGRKPTRRHPKGLVRAFPVCSPSRTKSTIEIVSSKQIGTCPGMPEAAFQGCNAKYDLVVTYEADFYLCTDDQAQATADGCRRRRGSSSRERR